MLLFISEYEKKNPNRYSTGTQSDKIGGVVSSQTKNKIFAVIFATLAMTGFAYANGMIKVSILYIFMFYTN